MLRLLLLVTLCVTLASVLPGHQADFSRSKRYSDNVEEDIRLDVRGLIKKYRYPIEVHNVVTEDGYILEMHRIPHGRDSNAKPGPRPIVFLMHGLLGCSADWVIMGPGYGFCYILAEEGYDVWMGNARGNLYSRRHIDLNPDAILNTTFWRFSWDEIGNYDLPAMIDYALGQTGQSRVHYIGHSQGTTSFFVMTSLRPAYNEKIIAMHAFAPAAYMENNRNPLLRFITPYSRNIEKIATLLGNGEFLPKSAIMSWAGQAMCRDEVVFQPICSNIMFLVFGWNEDQYNATMLPVIMGHIPSGASVRQFTHYGQGIADKGFRRYDLGSSLANKKAYGSIRPPNYDLSKITTPVYLHYSNRDRLVHVNDVDRLWRELGRPVGKFLIPNEKFSHLDFLWGIDAKELLYNRTINLIKFMDFNGNNAI